MELQIPHCVYAEVSAQGVFRRKTHGNQRDTSTIMPVERCGNNGREVCPDHIHMLVSIPPKMSVSGFMGYLKGKSAMLIFQRWGNMKFAYRNREFWCKGYYVDTVGKNTKAIKNYIAEQLKKDQETDQFSIYDPRDPFTGSK